jgi:hypothetical protein
MSSGTLARKFSTERSTITSVSWMRRFRVMARVEVMCECGRGCAERLQVPVGEYDRARREPTHFLVATPHIPSEVDRVIEDHGSWLLVEATGVAAEIARGITGPRAKL